jgi:hypothetical protein
MSRLIFDADTLGGTTTLSSADAVGNFTLIVPAVDGTLSVKDASGDATFRNLTLTGAVLAGAWNGTRIGVAYGGTGATTLTGYVKGNGTSAMTASSTIPSTDITGLGTMSVQNANAVAITGGTISGLSAAIPVASGGTGATTLTGYVKGNGTSLMTASATIPNTDITGLGTMSTQNANAVAITGGTISGLGTALAVASGGTGATTLTGLVYGNGTSAMTAASAAQVVAVIGSTAVANATLAATATLATTATNIAGGASGSVPYQTAAGTTSLLAAGTNGQVLSLVSGLPSWVSLSGAGTVTSVNGSGGTTGLTLTGGPITSSGTLTLGGTLAVANGGTGLTALGTGVQTAIGINVGTAGAVLVNGGVLGTPSSGTLTNATGLPVSTGISGLGTGVATALAVNVGSAGAPVVNGGALGTPSSGTVTNLTGTASININGTVGATTPAAGTFTSLSYSTTLTGGTGIVNFGSGQFYKDASGNVGIGTSSPSAYGKLVSVTGDNATTLAAVGATNMLRVQGYNSTYAGTVLESVNLAQNANTPMFINASQTLFGISGTERMRIDSSGNLLVGTTSQISGGRVCISGGASVPFTLRNSSTSAGKYWDAGPDNSNSYVVFNQSSTGVYVADGGVAWVANSDERLKTKLTPFKNSVDKICLLRSGTGRYLSDSESVSRSFLIAQDVQKILPEAVTVQNDEQKTLGLAYTDLIPLLVSAIQELKAIIDTQATRIAALEGNLLAPQEPK